MAYEDIDYTAKITKGEPPSQTTIASPEIERTWGKSFSSKEARLVGVRIYSRNRLTLSGGVRLQGLGIECEFEERDEYTTRVTTRALVTGEDMEKILGAIFDATGHTIVNVDYRP